jgi:hypothetical protein
MISILFAIGWFIIALVVQWLAYRLLRHYGRPGILSLIVYVLFLGIHLITIVYSGMQFPIVSSLIYCGVVLYVTIFFLTASRGEFGPSTKIHLLTKRPQGATRKELLNMFEVEDLIGLRIHDLTSDGLAKELKGKLYIDTKGKKVMRYVSFYRALLKWESSG